MKNKRGFTLIELLAVIAILSIIATVTVVIVEGTLKKSNNNISKIEKKNMEAVAKTYVAETTGVSSTIENMANEETFTLCDSALKSAGLIDESNNKNIKIVISKEGNKLNYDITNYTDSCTTSPIVNGGTSNVTPDPDPTPTPDPTPFKDLILNIETETTASPIFTTSSTDKGLYIEQNDALKTNSGLPVYYYRGAVTNNYVSFSGKIWRILRINEDSSVRLITQDTVLTNITYDNTSPYTSNYSGSNIETLVNNWYNTNITGTNATKVVNGTFCNATTGGGTPGNIAASTAPVRLSGLTPIFKCGYGDSTITAKAGLITSEEAMYAGILPYSNTASNVSYLSNGVWASTMTFSGTESGTGIHSINAVNAVCGVINSSSTSNGARIVINIDSTVTPTHSGSGTSGNPGTINNPYVIS